MHISRSGWSLVLIALLLLAAIAAKGLLIQPHPGATDFDTARAVGRLARILGDQRPHPVDTAANDAVRARLIAEIAALGLAAEVRGGSDCSGFPKSRAVSCSHVRNVVATLPGDPAKKALLLNAHYDSTPTGPGAADDGLGVASLLEIAAILRRERRARPVIFLFNEGEEYGLNGAAWFAQRDPLAQRVGRLINIDSRGVSGPAVMFETSSPNHAALADYAAAAPRPFANSLSADFAKLIPNSTDVVKFKPLGWEILNYANTGNETRYHSPGDNIAALDRATVSHMGGEALAAARRLAGPGEADGGGRMLYTDIAGWFLVRLPLVAGAALLAVLTIGALVMVQRRRAWRALGWFALAFAAAIGGAALVAEIAARIRPGDYWRAFPWAPTMAVAATVLAVLAPFAVLAAARHDRTQMRLAAWALVVVVGAAISLFMPGAIIFFLIAPALGLAGVRYRPLAWVGAVVSLVMFGELVALIELTLIDGPVWATAPLIALIALPFLAEVARSKEPRALLLIPVAALFWLIAMLVPRASADRPLAFTIDHVQDDRFGTAYWSAATKQAPLPSAFDRFGPWKTGDLPYNKRQRWLAKAPLIDGPRGNFTVMANTVEGTRRTVRLRLDRGGADALLLRFEEQVPVLAMGLPGRTNPVDPQADKGPSILRCSGRGCDGLTVEIMLGTARPVSVMLVAQRFAPPPTAAPLIAARPRNAQPQYSPDSEVRVRSLRL